MSPRLETVDDAVHRRAATFFISWLMLAAAMSLGGNVGHAVLIAPADTRWLAATAALVPPVVLLAATHSATWLIRVRSAGWVYGVSLALTAALTLGSFALSFDALRSFAALLGIRESMAWVWPAIIDVAIAHATLCLLSLKGGGRFCSVDPGADPRRPAVDPADVGATHDMPGAATGLNEPRGATGAAETMSAQQREQPDRGDSAGCGSQVAGDVAAPLSAPRQLSAADDTQAGRERVLSAVSTPLVSESAPRGETELTTCAAVNRSVERWRPVAESLVQEGVTSKSPTLIAEILADNEVGTPPSTIGRRHEVHHTTVARIVSAAEQLVDSSTQAG